MPEPPTAATRQRMQRQTRRDTEPEVRLRSALARRGLRFRKHVRAVPELRREVDVLFRSRRVAVFVDGCFWHGCPEHGRPSKSNPYWWAAKIERNKARDRETNEILTDAGWVVLRIWEHEDLESAVQRVEAVLAQQPTGRRR
jgi:DNA mismatch endonuclease (patch repair protein)